VSCECIERLLWAVEYSVCCDVKVCECWSYTTCFHVCASVGCWPQPGVMEMMPTILTCFQGGCYTKYTRSRCHNMRACETFLAKSQCRSGRFLKGTIAFNFFPKSPLIMFFFCTTGNCNLVFHDHFHPLFEPYLNDFWQIMWHEDWSNDAENWALPSQE